MTDERIYLAVVYGLIMVGTGVLQYLLPKISRQGTLMGVDLRVEDQKREEIVDIVGSYQRLVAMITLVSSIHLVYRALFRTEKVGLSLAFIFIYLGIFFLVYLKAHKKIKSYKEEHGLYVPVQRRAINLELAARPLKVKGFSMKTYLIPLVVILINLGLAIYFYDQAPDQIPNQWGFGGQVTSYSEKSWLSVLLPTIFTLVMFAINIFTHYGLLRMQKRLDPENPDEALERLIISRWYWSIYMLILTMMLIVLMTIINLLTLGLVGYTWVRGTLVVSLIIVIFSILAGIFIGLKVGNQGSRLRLGGKSQEDAFEDDDDHWILGGILYYNPEDPAVFIPKRVGVGATINMGTWQGKLMLAVLAVVLVSALVIAFIMD